MQEVTVRVPASTTNLGPGFDALGLALALHNRMTFRVTDGPTRVQVEGEGQDRLEAGPENLVYQAVERLCRAVDRPAPALEIRLRNAIPVSRGLGSSSTAIVGGLVGANALLGEPLDQDGLLALAAEMEGHPDNVAAAIRGGFVVCADDAPVRFDPTPGLEGVIVTPPQQVATAEARAALPKEVPIGDAVHNASHVALLILGLAGGDLDLVARGLDDRIHQPRRAHLYPRSMELVARARDLGAIGATISGAGPTVLFWSHWDATAGLVQRLHEEAPDCDVQRVQFQPAGADVREL